MDAQNAQYYLIYSILVAGKSAKFAEKKTNLFVSGRNDDESPFDLIRRLMRDDILMDYLKVCKTGCYTKLNKTFRGIVNLDAQTCDLTELEAIHGIGPKTSRFFIMWTRPDERYAALDTHILKWLKYLGYDVPKSTPSGNKYMEVQEIFLKEADERGRSPQELDGQIWEHCQQGLQRGGYWPEELKKKG